MTLILAGTVGALFALGTFLLLREDLIKVVLGLSILTQAANVYLIAMGGIQEGSLTSIPILATKKDPPMTVDPLVQALVLTAIVISFGVTAFMLTLAFRTYEENESLRIGEWEQ
jgi:multicomponent Na+:H+ antiporter subunit C